MNLSNSQGAFKQTLIGYINGATNDYDSSFDGETFGANKFLDFYSINKGLNLTIQGRVLSFEVNDQVPLGYSSTIGGSFTIDIAQMEGEMSARNIFILDKVLNITQKLNESPYTFTTDKGTFNERFVLSYANKAVEESNTLSTGNFETADKAIVISSNNKEIKISTASEIIDKVFIYAFSGRQIYQKSSVATNELIIKNLIQGDQVLIVNIVLQNGKSTIQKIIY